MEKVVFIHLEKLKIAWLGNPSNVQIYKKLLHKEKVESVNGPLKNSLFPILFNTLNIIMMGASYKNLKCLRACYKNLQAH